MASQVRRNEFRLACICGVPLHNCKPRDDIDVHEVTSLLEVKSTSTISKARSGRLGAVDDVEGVHDDVTMVDG